MINKAAQAMFFFTGQDYQSVVDTYRALSIHFVWLQDIPTYFVLYNCYFLQSNLFEKEVAGGRSKEAELT
jgi:hypothetical protein